MSVFAEQAAKNMQDAFADFLFDPFKDGLGGMVDGFASHAAQDGGRADRRETV